MAAASRYRPALRHAAVSWAWRAAALLFVACSGPAGAPGSDSASSGAALDEASGSGEPLGVPGSDTLLLLGGQTGSDVTPERGEPCTSVVSSEHALADVTQLGFSGDDVLETLRAAPAAVALRWDSGEPITVNLVFDSEARVSVVERMPTAQDVVCLGPLLRLNVSVGVSSERQGTLGTWQTHLFAESADRFAGVGTAVAAALGRTLLTRSGDPDALRLTYEMADGRLRGWLSAGNGAGRIVAEF
jgi:hypothetical protein